MTIKTLKDLLNYHETALRRHQVHHAKRLEQYPNYPGIVRVKQQADQYRIDHHQAAVRVLQEAVEEQEAHAGEMRAQAALAEMSLP